LYTPENVVAEGKMKIYYDYYSKLIYVLYENDESGYFIQLNTETSLFSLPSASSVPSSHSESSSSVEEELHENQFLGRDSFNIPEATNSNMHEYNRLKKFQLQGGLQGMQNVKGYRNLVFIAKENSIEIYIYKNESVSFLQSFSASFNSSSLLPSTLQHIQRIQLDKNSLWVLDAEEGLFEYFFERQGEDSLAFKLQRQIVIKGANYFSLNSK
jgi:hypothetical protein